MDKHQEIKVYNEKYFQPNLIARAVYSMGAVTKKLLAYGIHKAFTNNRDFPPLKATFTISEFQNSLGIEKGGKSKIIILGAIEELARSFITIDDGNLYQCFTWLNYAYYNKLDNEINLTFSNELAEQIRNFKLGYSAVDLIKIGSLKSIYAIRWYEIALSYKGHKGKNFNESDKYYFSYTIEEIRTMFNLKDKYKSTKNLRFRIVTEPLEELNKAHINMRIEPDYIYKGKKLIEIKFNVTILSDKKEQKIITTEKEKQENERLENEINSMISDLRKKYNSEYNSIFSEIEKQKLSRPIGKSLAKNNKVSFAQIVESATIQELAKKYNPDLFILLTTTK